MSSTLGTDLVRADCLEVLKGRAELLQPLKNDSVFITGGTGFAGTWLAELIAALNDEYRFGIRMTLASRNTDRFAKAHPHLTNRKDVRLQSVDVRHLTEVPADTNWFIHAAGNPNNRFHSSQPIETMSVIADGTMSALRAVERCSNFKMFLNLSSGWVNDAHFHSGTLASVYVDAKRFGETVATAYRSQARTPVITARPYAFIGPYQSLDTPWAINSFIADALAGNPIRVLGDGQTVRSYMYPSDMAFWLLRIMTAGVSGSHYNVGSAEEVRLADLAGMIAAQVNPRSEIRLHTSPTAGGTPGRLVPDVSAPTRALNLSVTVPLAQALERTLRWNRSRM